MIPLNVSPWVSRWSSLIPAGGKVLDLACGTGRHSVYLAGLGHPVLGVDRDMSLSSPYHGIEGVEWLEADLEAAPWPLADRQFQGILVSRYLHRPLFEPLLAALSPGGVLIYETFAMGQARYGRPRNPVHLLMRGELLEWVRGRLRVLAYEDVDEPERKRCMQRICARRV